MYLKQCPGRKSKKRNTTHDCQDAKNIQKKLRKKKYEKISFVLFNIGKYIKNRL